jgi:broad specificity phosphatase PhoE
MTLKTAGDFPVYFARHGETTYNRENRVQGWQDSSLTESGRKQAQEIAVILRDFVSTNDAPRFVCSPLGRARHTMEIVLGVLGLPTDHYTSDERLLEVDYGEWSGRYIPDIETNARERWEARERDKWNVPAPGGESYAAVALRASSWFSDLRHETVAIGHGAFGRILRGLYQGLSWQEMATMDEPQGVVFRFQQGTIARIEPPLAVAPFDDPAPGP